MAAQHRGGNTGGTNNNSSDGESVDVGKEISETIEPFVPWAISVLVHSGVLLLTVFMVWTAAMQQVIDDEPIVPVIRLSNTPRMVHLDTHKPTNANNNPNPYQPTPMDPSNGGSRGTDAFGPGPNGHRKGGGTGDDNGPGTNGLKMALSPIGPTNPFKSGVSGRSDFHAKFMETEGNARRIVYLIDASGSLIDTLPFVLLELKRSVSQLSQEQSFTVIFFQGKEPHEVTAGGRGLKTATPANKQLLNAWVDVDAGNVVPAGLSNPIKAMRLALSYKPELIFLLSDNITGQGRYEVDQRELLREINHANQSLTKINTIQFIRPDPLKAVGMPGTMELIAEQMGGIYKYMGARELNIQ